MSTELERAITALAQCRKDAETQAASLLAALDIREFEPANDGTRDMLAIDGSYAFLLNFSDIWLAVVRVSALHYRIDARSCFKLVDEQVTELPVVAPMGDRSLFAVPEVGRGQDIGALKRLGLRSPAELVNEYRRVLEHRMLERLTREHEHCIVALDGTLTTSLFEAHQAGTKGASAKGSEHVAEPFDALMSTSLRNCREHDNLLVGVSKDSGTRSFDSIFTDEELLARCDKGCSYAQAPASFSRKYRPPLYGAVYFARLFTRAKYFRIDTPNAPELVFPLLACYARSSICPGYPYPLFEAHRSAVTVRKFKRHYEDALLAHSATCGLNLLDLLTDIEGKRKSSFHYFLDEMCR